MKAPALVVMGGADPDFPDPAAEAQLVADRLGGEVLVVPDVGHYPQAEAPEVTGRAILEFLRTMARAGVTPARVTDVAADVADREGLGALTLAAVAGSSASRCRASTSTSTDSTACGAC